MANAVVYRRRRRRLAVRGGEGGVSATLVIVALLLIIATATQDASTVLELLDPTEGHILNTSQALRFRWRLNRDALGWNHVKVRGPSLCAQVTSGPSVVLKHCYSKCDLWPLEITCPSTLGSDGSESNSHTFDRFLSVSSNGLYEVKSMVVDGTQGSPPQVLSAATPTRYLLRQNESDLYNDTKRCRVLQFDARSHKPSFCSLLVFPGGGTNRRRGSLQHSRVRLCYGSPFQEVHAVDGEIESSKRMSAKQMCLWTNLMENLNSRMALVLHTNGLGRPHESAWLLNHALRLHPKSRLTAAGHSVSADFQTVMSSTPSGLQKVEILAKMTTSDALLSLLNLKRRGTYDVIVLEAGPNRSEMMTQLLLAWRILKIDGVLIVSAGVGDDRLVDDPESTCESVATDETLESFLALFDDAGLVVSGKPCVLRRCELIALRKTGAQ